MAKNGSRGKGKGTNLHVVKGGPKTWLIKVENQSAPIGSARTQEAAHDRGRKVLEQTPGGGEVFIHRRNGPIRERDTIERKDPHPPKG